MIYDSSYVFIQYPNKSMDKQNFCVSLVSAYYFAPLIGTDRLPSQWAKRVIELWRHDQILRHQELKLRH